MVRVAAGSCAMGAGAIVVAWLSGCGAWSGMINWMMPADSRPGEVDFKAVKAAAAGFDSAAKDLAVEFKGKTFPHAEKFAKAGIYSYEGPRTCLKCHEAIKFKDAKNGEERAADLMDNILTSAHYRFFTTSHENVWGFNGVQADDFPMGKIDRPCPKPGSFAFTAWAETVTTGKGKVYSEGCGQCHIGGQYQAPLGEIMPAYKTLDSERTAIDCLLCHAQAYDMNRKQVVGDKPGQRRWDQDRSLKAAISVTRTTAQTCLRCHQHNMGGDVYVDDADPSYMQSIRNPGKDRPRVMHPGSKRGTPYSPTWDVHAAAGMACTECHPTEGHFIARGTHTTTLMANDLPGVAVTCEKCHGDTPHPAKMPSSADYNRHTARVACTTCHIPSLHPDNATMRDFARTVYEEAADLHIYSDTSKETAPGKAIKYAWWNGDGSFLGNPIGDNPNGRGLYTFYKLQHPWPEFKDFDYAGWYEKKMRPIARLKPSKIYAMKLYNGRQHIDLQNMGPFGGMFVPYNLPVYLSTGDADAAAKAEVRKPMMAMMYGFMFDVYLMDQFMRFMEIDGWRTSAYDDVKELRHVEPRWIPTDPLMEISHAVRKKGALTCDRCHAKDGVIDWKDLGYADDEIARLTASPPAPGGKIE